jgi:hypothetical protein
LLTQISFYFSPLMAIAAASAADVVVDPQMALEPQIALVAQIT